MLVVKQVTLAISLGCGPVPLGPQAFEIAGVACGGDQHLTGVFCGSCLVPNRKGGFGPSIHIRAGAVRVEGGKGGGEPSAMLVVTHKPWKNCFVLEPLLC